MVETPEGLRRKALGGEVIHLHLANYLTEEQVNQLKQQPFLTNSTVRYLPNQVMEIVVDDDAGTILPKLLDYVKQRQIDVISAEEYVPPFDDIFVHLIENETARQKEGVNA
jgi:ABC-2 type transport system ATP-binding protein